MFSAPLTAESLTAASSVFIEAWNAVQEFDSQRLLRVLTRYPQLAQVCALPGEPTCGKTLLMRLGTLRQIDGEEGRACFEALLPLSDLYARDEHNKTALMAFAGNEKTPTWMIKALIPGSEVNAVNVFGNSALMLAAYHGSNAVLCELLPQADARLKNNRGKNALFFSIQRARVKNACALMARSDLEARDHQDWNALTHAVKAKSPMLVEALLGAGACGSAATAGRTALEWAVATLDDQVWDIDPEALECWQVIDALHSVADKKNAKALLERAQMANQDLPQLRAHLERMELHEVVEMPENKAKTTKGKKPSRI